MGHPQAQTQMRTDRGQRGHQVKMEGRGEKMGKGSGSGSGQERAGGPMGVKAG